MPKPRYSLLESPKLTTTAVQSSTPFSNNENDYQSSILNTDTTNKIDSSSGKSNNDDDDDSEDEILLDSFKPHNKNKTNNNNDLSNHQFHSQVQEDSEDITTPPANTTTTITKPQQQQQQKGTIGLLTGTSLVISQLIGSGIFSTPSSVMDEMKSPLMALTIWIVGAIITIGGALAFCEMGLMFPKNGGMMRYLTKAYPKPNGLFGFVFGWSIIFFMRPAGMAAGGIVFAKYLMYAIVGRDEWKSRGTGGSSSSNSSGGGGGGASFSLSSSSSSINLKEEYVVRGVAFAGITCMALLNYFSVKWALRCIKIMAFFKIVVLTIITVVGIACMTGAYKPQGMVQGLQEMQGGRSTWERGFSGTSTSVNDYVKAFNRVFWAYEGWANLHYVAGEIRNPRRNMPLAIGLGISVTGLLYVLVNAAFITVVPFETFREAGETLGAVYTNIVFGHVVGERILPLFICLSVLAVPIADLYSGCRLIAATAEMGYIGWADKLSTTKKGGRGGGDTTPVVSLACLWCLAIVFLMGLPPGKVFDRLLDLTQYPGWIFYGLTVAGVIFLRKRYPSHPLRTFRVWLPYTFPFIGLCAILAVAAFVPPHVDKNKTPEGGDGNSQKLYFLSPLLGLVFISSMSIPWYFIMVRGNKNKRGGIGRRPSQVSLDGNGSRFNKETESDDEDGGAFDSYELAPMDTGGSDNSFSPHADLSPSAAAPTRIMMAQAPQALKAGTSYDSHKRNTISTTRPRATSNSGDTIRDGDINSNGSRSSSNDYRYY
ncbi:hypothetical protein H4219_005005 [Mycoemilia scoparia]|uniref:Uncharacterized protein n=1 Tax=Mycoemilia scoparia TaxID=417184 RepID=A0A9W7ZQN5_9FUNG|nr:hypothetical protein H4219_005005 [Mycoemilia scoparia]